VEIMPFHDAPHLGEHGSSREAGADPGGFAACCRDRVFHWEHCKVLAAEHPRGSGCLRQSRDRLYSFGTLAIEGLRRKRTIHRPKKEYSVAKAQDAKKETKKKPEKTLKEKRIEKQAKKSSKAG
jgi:hypothetical protein